MTEVTRERRLTIHSDYIVYLQECINGSKYYILDSNWALRPMKISITRGRFLRGNSLSSNRILVVHVDRDDVHNLCAIITRWSQSSQIPKSLLTELSKS